VKVGVIGGGIMGACLGYFLARAGAQVEIYEASPLPGGLAGPLTLPDGAQIDRFYHAILSTDAHLRALCAELGLADRLRFRPTRTGFYHQGRIHPLSGPLDLLRFRPLGPLDRLRLGLTALRAQQVRDWQRLEGIRAEDWLVQLGGRRLFETVWKPMFKAKFEAGFDTVPATYVWSRLVRTKPRGGRGREQPGHLIGGYATLIEALVARLEAHGGRLRLRCPVQEIAIEANRVRGVRLADGLHPLDAVVATVQTPVFERLIPAAPPEYRAYLARRQYLGIICPVLVLDRPLTGYWTLYLADEQVPFTGIIETTSYLDPAEVGGHHLVYLPKYTSPGSHWQTLSDQDLRQAWLEHLEAMLPDFDRRALRYCLIHRERYVEPLHGLDSTRLIPPIRTPIDNLFLATTAQIYPELTNGESVSRHARRAAATVLERAGQRVA
jgi:protoporphyrinogen oxidase